jgi:hypothetical protein
VRADLYQYILFCQHEHVKVPRLVKGAVHEGQKHLVHNVRAVLAGVTPVLFAQVDVVVAIQQLKTTAALHSLQRALLQYNMHYRLWGQFLTRWSLHCSLLFSAEKPEARGKKKKKKKISVQCANVNVDEVGRMAGEHPYECYMPGCEFSAKESSELVDHMRSPCYARGCGFSAGGAGGGFFAHARSCEVDGYIA